MSTPSLHQVKWQLVLNFKKGLGAGDWGLGTGDWGLGKRYCLDTPLPKGEGILGSTSPLKLDPLRYLAQRWFSPKSVYFPRQER
ncbi:hypothetical protein JYQ62_36895 [Nostoc sp. UHCC 0702]|nr:hypothetical protein JYQ62_36895 [Nostoc sp. UHCC 0702]